MFPIANRYSYLRFNLVIENLFFSSSVHETVMDKIVVGFQSRNRESFLFKSTRFDGNLATTDKFQSRNRESFLFKRSRWGMLASDHTCFNLVIENLFF